MYKNVREVFNDHCSNLSIDTKLCDRIEQYLNSFITKSPEHAQFLVVILLAIQLLSLLTRIV